MVNRLARPERFQKRNRFVETVASLLRVHDLAEAAQFTTAVDAKTETER